MVLDAESCQSDGGFLHITLGRLDLNQCSANLAILKTQGLSDGITRAHGPCLVRPRGRSGNKLCGKAGAEASQYLVTNEGTAKLVHRFGTGIIAATK